MGSPLTPAFERLDEARRIAAELRITRKNDQAVAEALSILEAALLRAADELRGAALVFEHQSQRLTQLSSLVAGATARHF
jgi:hypothetical protein